MIHYCYSTLRENCKHPQKAHINDAGLDVFFNPENGKDIIIPPQNNALLHTGIVIAIPKKYVLQVCNRSSIAHKRNLVYGAHIIDAGYDGEIFIDLHNIGKQEQLVKVGDKIAQLVLLPAVTDAPRHVSRKKVKDLNSAISQREGGSLGSSD